ncbi:hypothetical protein ACFSLT_22560 [Novosphingobium resinovorum]
MFDRRRFLGSGAALLGSAAFARHAFAAGAARNAGQLDVALVGGSVWTGGAGGRSDAIGIVGDRIVAVGADAVRARMARSTRVIDLNGAFALPRSPTITPTSLWAPTPSPGRTCSA